MEYNLIYFKGSVIEVQPPSPYVFEVVECDPNVKGNFAQGVTKPAVLDVVPPSLFQDSLNKDQD